MRLTSIAFDSLASDRIPNSTLVRCRRLDCIAASLPHTFPRRRPISRVWQVQERGQVGPRRPDQDWFGAAYWLPHSEAHRAAREAYLGTEVCRHVTRAAGMQCRVACRIARTLRKTAIRRRPCLVEVPNHSRVRGFPNFFSWHRPPCAPGHRVEAACRRRFPAPRLLGFYWRVRPKGYQSRQW